MTTRRLTFGAVAAGYERFRPGYPEAAVDLVLDYAGRPVRSALEIGAGTGKATRAFARHDIAVTATDPDPAMLVELRKHVPSTVATVTAAGIIAPVVAHDPSVNTSLVVLAVGTGSLFFSHVNDAGFWLINQYFGMSVKDTIKTWSVMETIISVVGMAFVMLLSVVV